MKRVLSGLLILVAALLTGCGDHADQEAAATPVPAHALAEQTPDAAVFVTQEAFIPDFYDVDLAGMGATMVYSYVYSIVSDPAQYVGQRFRVRGTYQITHWSETDLDYNFVIVSDATACCTQGLEFLLDDGLSYPAAGDQIEITGTFGSYDELDETYYYIQADSIRTWE